MRCNRNKNNHLITINIYTKYMQSKAILIKMPVKMITDLKIIAKEQNQNLSELIRQTLLNKYHFKLLDLNRKKDNCFTGDIEDMPLE